MQGKHHPFSLAIVTLSMIGIYFDRKGLTPITVTILILMTLGILASCVVRINAYRKYKTNEKQREQKFLAIEKSKPLPNKKAA